MPYLSPPSSDLSSSLIQFINALFCMITGMALARFAGSAFIKNVLDQKPADFRALALFVASFFFLVSDWVFYHSLMSDFPYLLPFGIIRFGLEVVVFATMYMVVYLSTQEINLYRVKLHIGTICAWHLMVYFWHYLAYLEYPNKILTPVHLVRFASYFVLLNLLCYASSKEIVRGRAQHILTESRVVTGAIFVVISLILYFNVTRLQHTILHGGTPAPDLLRRDSIVMLAVGILAIGIIGICRLFSKQDEYATTDGSAMRITAEEDVLRLAATLPLHLRRRLSDKITDTYDPIERRVLEALADTNREKRRETALRIMGLPEIGGVAFVDPLGEGIESNILQDDTRDHTRNDNDAEALAHRRAALLALVETLPTHLRRRLADKVAGTYEDTENQVLALVAGLSLLERQQLVDQIIDTPKPTPQIRKAVDALPVSALPVSASSGATFAGATKSQDEENVEPVVSDAVFALGETIDNAAIVDIADRDLTVTEETANR